MNAVERQINKIYQEVWKKIFTKKRLAGIMSGKTKHIQIAAHNLENAKAYKAFCEEFAKKLAQKGLAQQKGVWRKYYNAAKKLKHGVLEATWSEFEKKQFEKAVNANFNMIKSIPQKVLATFKEKSVKVLITQVAEGSLGRGTFEKLLRNKGATNARVIARTETAKLQTTIIQNRATDLGSVCYQWSSTRDKRTRQSHKDMNNVIVFWRQKLEERPLLDKMYGNAGEFPNCRCTPEPIFDESDLKSLTYKVYDYRKHKIVSMTKKNLLLAIQSGQL